MKLVIITGMSGAGKASAARIFEDMDYTVVDNLPPILLPELVEKCLGAGEQPPASHLAVVVDTRAGAFFMGWEPAVAMVRARGVDPVILFFDAADTVLVQRFKETRRKHPLFDQHNGILGSIKAERALVDDLKEASDKVVDTSDLTIRALRELLVAEFLPSQDRNQGLTIIVTSFGFKHGLPLDADLVFDVRFLINPHYVDALRPLDGRTAEVAEYVMGDPDAPIFLEKLYDLMQFSVPQYIEEGKAYLTVAIGCTGGRHRSVLVAEKLTQHLGTCGYRVLVQHRDVTR